jgi:hypothetical protein
MYLEGILMYIKIYVFLMVNRCILKDTKVFECFSMHLGVFTTYFIILVVYFNLIRCIYSIFQCILVYLNKFECILNVLIVYLW